VRHQEGRCTERQRTERGDGIEFFTESTLCAAHCADCREVHARLRKHLPHYDKTRPRFADFAAGPDQAVRRAEKLGDDHTRNPSTGVWRLVGAVLEKQ